MHVALETARCNLSMPDSDACSSAGAEVKLQTGDAKTFGEVRRD